MQTNNSHKLGITISGLHGTGKTTYARALANIFKLKHISAGGLFRKIMAEKGLSIQALSKIAMENKEIDDAIDTKIRAEAEQGSFVIDGLLSAWTAGRYANTKIYLTASDESRFKRLALRDKLSIEEARALTLEREKIEKERYMKFYGLNLNDLSVYDTVLNTDLMPIKSNIKILATLIREYIKVKWG